MTRQVMEYYQDQGGNVTVEYSNGDVDQFSLTKTVTIDSEISDSGKVILSSAVPVDADGRPDGTIYIQTA